MDMLYDGVCNMSSNNLARKSSPWSARHSNPQASAYSVNISTMALAGFHLSTLGAGGVGCWV